MVESLGREAKRLVSFEHFDSPNINARKVRIEKWLFVYIIGNLCFVKCGV